MDRKKLMKLLRKIPVFRGLEEKEIEQLMCFLEEEKFAMGDDILVEYESEKENKMYVILDGRVEVLKKAPSKEEEEIHLNLLKPGETFGEMSLIDDMVRSANVRAVTPTRTLVLSKWNLNRLFELHPKVYGKLMRNIAKQISRRLRRADVLHASMKYKEQVSKEMERKSDDNFPTPPPPGQPLKVSKSKKGSSPEDKKGSESPSSTREKRKEEKSSEGSQSSPPSSPEASDSQE